MTTVPFRLPEGFRPDYYKEPVTDKDLWDLEVTARGLFHYFQSSWLSRKIQLYDIETDECTDLRVVVRSFKFHYTPSSRPHCPDSRTLS